MDGRRLALWAGVEPSVVRIGDRYVDQVRETGHHHRPDDIERLAQLGIAAVRYPVLWERIAPEGLRRADWSWADERLGRLRDAGIEPVVTLLHHGSGPRYTSLIDPEFPRKLAAFAGAVARRYPWIRRFTPVNEPLTTARFSALYGLWYPHLRDDTAFTTALLNEIEGTAAAMAAIRATIPRAQLVQTEDLGKTYSTAPLAYQARLENARRWTSLDLLCGRFGENGEMLQWLQRLGLTLSAATLERYRCEPATIAFNYYITSERYLDDDISRYPSHVIGGNGRDRYADVEAVRVRAEGVAGITTLCREAWERYGLPMAIGEAHLGASVDEQLRWLEEIYGDALRLQERGVDLRAVTVWSVFGAWNWNSMLTRDENHYETGCFDARCTPPKETALAEWVRARARGSAFQHEALDSRGWWRQPARLVYEARFSSDAAADPLPRAG